MTVAELPVPSRKEIVRNTLEELWASRGRITPTDVVQEAASTSSPLHDYFEWDDSKAANRYRLFQAANLIRTIKVTIVSERPSGEVEDIQVRGFMALRSAGDETAPAGYVPEHVVREDPEKRRIMLQQMKREMTALHRRYRHLDDYWSVMADLVADQPAEAG